MLQLGSCPVGEEFLQLFLPRKERAGKKELKAHGSPTSSSMGTPQWLSLWAPMTIENPMESIPYLGRPLCRI